MLNLELLLTVPCKFVIRFLLPRLLVRWFLVFSMLYNNPVINVVYLDLGLRLWLFLRGPFSEVEFCVP